MEPIELLRRAADGLFSDFAATADRRRSPIEQGRKRGALTNKEQAEWRHAMWKELAAFIFRHSPNTSVKHVVAEIRKHCIELQKHVNEEPGIKVLVKKNGKPFDASTIAKSIKGVKTKTLREH